MDNRPIGVFDSGLGGLTAVKTLREILPGEDIVFLGDTGRVPYGNRSSEVIRKYAVQCLNFLAKQDVKLIVVACGTVSSVLGKELDHGFCVPCIGVLEPTVKTSLKETRNGKIGVIATAATVASGSYEKIAHEINSDSKIFSKACPLFVPLVENGYFGENCAPTKIVAKDYLAEFDDKDIDTLILGCTHYPLLYDLIDDVTGHRLSLVSAGREVAVEAKNYLEKQGKLSNSEKNGTMRFFVTDEPDGFQKLGKSFLGEELTNVEKVDVEEKE